MTREFNNLILKQAPKFTVSETAPSTERELFTSTSLVVWSGASDNTIWSDPNVNYAFRALHDALHLKTGIGFSPAEEIQLGRIQASQYSGLLSDLVYIEVAGQAEHYMRTGEFVLDQVEFTRLELIKIGYSIKVVNDLFKGV